MEKFNYKTIKKLGIATGIISALAFTSCTSETTTDHAQQEVSEALKNNKGYNLVHEMVQKVGDYSKLLAQKDVVYTYTYSTADNKINISTEKYIFENELSYGIYQKHERTFPQLEGEIEQGYDGTNYWLANKGALVEDEKLMKKVIFGRHTNYYWFTMFQKLEDPGLTYEYIEEKTIEGSSYDVVKVSFESTDGKPKDIYQLYINKKTGLVDQFLFTVADFGKMDPKLMKVEYEEVNGFLLPTKRKYQPSDWDATETKEGPWATANWSDIKFNNKLTIADFKLK